MKRKTLLVIIIAVLAITPIVILLFLLSDQRQVPALAKQLPTELLSANTDWQPPTESRPIILIFYSPSCDHCQAEAQNLSTHPTFQEQTIYWLSGATPKANRTFQETYAPDAPQRFQFLEDPDYRLADALEVSIFPTIFIYNSEGKLRRHYEGETKPERLLNWLD